jgi:hypothetical protein
MWSAILIWKYMHNAANAVHQAMQMDPSLKETYKQLYNKAKIAEEKVNEAARKGLLD